MRGKVPMGPRKQSLPENWVSWQSTSKSVGWFSLMSLTVLSSNYFLCTFNVVGSEYTAMNKSGVVLVKGQAEVGGRKVFPIGAPESQSSDWDISHFSYLQTELRTTNHLQFVRTTGRVNTTSSNVHTPSFPPLLSPPPPHPRNEVWPAWPWDVNNEPGKRQPTLFKVTQLQHSWPETAWP